MSISPKDMENVILESEIANKSITDKIYCINIKADIKDSENEGIKEKIIQFFIPKDFVASREDINTWMKQNKDVLCNLMKNIQKGNEHTNYISNPDLLFYINIDNTTNYKSLTYIKDF